MIRMAIIHSQIGRMLLQFNNFANLLLNADHRKEAFRPC